MILGVVADDITGSNDIGSMFAKAGLRTHIYTFAQLGDDSPMKEADHPDVCILNTNSRLDSEKEAYQKVFRATKKLQEMGFDQFHKKTCSVFRGNIGAEFDAMLDALNLDFAVVVAGFPKNGRKTIDGVHYVHGKKLEESEFKNDPIHPMTQSNLIEILGEQTERKVRHISHRVIQRGAETIRKFVDDVREQCSYLIFDVKDQESLATIAEAVQDEPVICGSSAIGEELPHAWGLTRESPEVLSLQAHPEWGILCASGSLMPQTREQILYFEAQGAKRVELDVIRLFNDEEHILEINSLTSDIVHELQAGRHVVFHSPNTPHRVDEARLAGEAQGLSRRDISRYVSDAIAEVTSRVMGDVQQNRLLIAGGETSAAVCERLGVTGFRVWKEIQPGLPSCVSLTGPELLLVLKSGSFGKADFFERAVQHLEAQ